MKAKEKANELVDKMYDVDSTDDYGELTMNYKHAKKCALIAVDEIIKALNDDIYIQGETDIDSHINYWQEVKQELKNL